MSNKVFLGIITALILGVVGFIVLSGKNSPKQPPLGTSHKDQGANHIPRGSAHPAYNSDPPNSGWHYSDSNAPVQWGVYTQEVLDEEFLHNQEHGGVIITYRPDLPADQIKKLQALFAPPYSDPKFKPSKAVVTPRSKNTKPIGLAAWGYTLNLDTYDEEKIKNFYLQRVSKSPEPTAGPFNTPINQANQ